MCASPYARFYALAVAACVLTPIARGAELPVDPGGPAELPGSAPPADILKQIGERQTELALLELAIKKAELQKKLQELQIPRELPRPLVADTPDQDAAPNHRIAVNIGLYAVRRVHRVKGELMASLTLPNGDVLDVKKGTSLADDIVVTDVGPGGVSVRRGGGQPYRLPPMALSSVSLPTGER